jgi:hypothetical protein
MGMPTSLSFASCRINVQNVAAWRNHVAVLGQCCKELAKRRFDISGTGRQILFFAATSQSFIATSGTFGGMVENMLCGHLSATRPQEILNLQFRKEALTVGAVRVLGRDA